MKTFLLSRAAAGAALLLAFSAGSAIAQRAVSTRPVSSPGGVARTPQSPASVPSSSGTGGTMPAPSAAAPSSGSSRPSNGGTVRDTVLVPVAVIGASPAVNNGNYVATGGGYVVQGPPPLQMENAGIQPYPAMTWVPGRWEWNGGSYFWRSGEWVYIPAGFTQWVPGKWDHNSYGWFWINGYWK